MIFLKVREAKGRDFEAIQHLYLQLNPEDDWLVDSAKRTFDEIIRSKNLHLLVAELENEILGSIYLNIIPNLSRNSRPYAVIENVITHKDFRKRGIGRALMQRAIELATGANCYKIMLLTGRDDESVHQFYRSFGFDGESKHAYVLRQ